MSDNVSERLISMINDKLDNIQKDVSEMKVEQAVMKTNMERDLKDKVPERLEKLETFKNKAMVVVAMMMIIVPTVVSVVARKVIG